MNMTEEEEGAAIMALLEDDGSTFEEEMVDGVMRSLERDVIGVVDAPLLLSSTFTFCGENCYLQSDSAYSLTSSSARVSDPDDIRAIGCQCVCGGDDDQFGYLMEASDEELGLSPPPHGSGCSSENWVEDCGLAAMESISYLNEMQDLELGDVDEDFMGMEIEGFPFLCPLDYQ